MSLRLLCSLLALGSLQLACDGTDAPDAGGAGDAAVAADAQPLDAAPADVGTVLYVRYPLDGNADEASDARKNGTGVEVSPAPDRHGNPGAALHFDSAASVVTISNVELVPPFSVSLWWDRSGHGPADQGCIAGEISAILFAGYRFLIDVEPDQAWVAYALAHESPPPQLDPALRARTSTSGWHHLVLVDEIDHGALWLDGQQVKTGTIADTARHASFFTLGGHPSFPCGLQGSLDEVRVYRGPLGAAEIGALFRE